MRLRCNLCNPIVIVITISLTGNLIRFSGSSMISAPSDKSIMVVVNINMTIGLGPITGIPLPWLSYGRSAMLVNFIALGLCASVSRRGIQSQKRW